MERRLVCEEKTENSIRKVFVDESGNISEEFYAMSRGEMRRCSKTGWASAKNVDIYGREDSAVLDEFFKSKLGDDYRKVG